MSLADHLRHDHRRFSLAVEEGRVSSAYVWVLADLDQAAEHIDRLTAHVDALQAEVANARAAQP